MVPLSEYAGADLARELELPLLVVARPGLGTINHTVSHLFCRTADGLQVAGVHYQRMPDIPGLAEKGRRTRSLAFRTSVLGSGLIATKSMRWKWWTNCLSGLDVRLKPGIVLRN